MESELIDQVAEATAAEALRDIQDFSGKIDGGGIKNAFAKEGKCPVNLIPPMFIEGVAEVLKHGARKYAKNNWMRGMAISEVVAGIERHALAIRRGEDFDICASHGGARPEDCKKCSGLPHAWCIGCGSMFLTWYLHGPNSEQYRQFDDRIFRSPPASQVANG